MLRRPADDGLQLRIADIACRIQAQLLQVAGPFQRRQAASHQAGMGCQPLQLLHPAAVRQLPSPSSAPHQLSWRRLMRAVRLASGPGDLSAS